MIAKIRNKKADSLMAILLIVMLTFVLLGLSFFYLAYRAEKIRQITSSGIENVYIREELINFYIQNIMDSSVKISGGNKATFISEFKKRVNLYKRNGEFTIVEFGQIEPQLQEDKIIIEDGKMGLPLEFKISGWTTENEIYTEYFYRKTFEGTIEKV
jgi:hypothetical protein